MGLSDVVRFVHFLLGLLLFMSIWHFGVRPYLLDRFRSELFDLRDELFDYAAEGNIPFDDPVYGALRDWLNVLIRMAHRITFLDTIVITQLSKEDVSVSESVERKLECLGDIMTGEKGETLQNFAFRSFVLSGKYLLLRSPALWIPFLASILHGLLSGLHRSTRRYLNDKFVEWGGKIEEQARLTGGVPS